MNLLILSTGTTQFYVFCNPNDKENAKIPAPDYETAQAEIAEKSGGFDMSSAKTRGNMFKEGIAMVAILFM